ncbi:protein NLP4-like [Durio zibethinus]|uniref:Protein NLP4-like n=1 Tax=Durio zibethinus TaxID=66656 RepID=A0A6P6B5V3_DURZI|nr:protein NLP4-like [Durio zibethinus]XP_022772562.1 protein NLP4-like [Durio zibethinus]
MEDAIFSPGAMLGGPPDSAMDFDYMDDLLLDGCWLETTGGSEFLNPSPSSSNALFDSASIWPSSEPNTGDLGGGLPQVQNQGENQRPLLPGNSHVNETQGESWVSSHFSHNLVVVDRDHSLHGDCITDGCELSRRWWIGPTTNPGPTTSVMQRLIQALGYIKDFGKEKDVLVQLWVPVNRGGKRVLTTSEQPFSLDPNSQKLASYRNISVNYQFAAEEDSKDMAGLPGRVFLSKVPEWTPDVRFFRSDEYPRVHHAQQHDVRGTFALPVFEQGSRTCLGVIEVVMTTEKIRIRPELESVCKALEAVNLRSSIASSTQNIKACNNSYQAALPEIKEVLRFACETHRLPLAQTWVPCIQQGKEGCRHSTENYVHCVSTVDDICYIADPNIRGFHEACSEHHLLKGQGVVGGAFMTNQPCFSADITSFKKTEYPLAHHARIFKLHAAVAIRLRCIHTGKTDFILEFFLPVDCRAPEEQKKMLNLLSIIIEQVCCSLRVVTDKELEEETDLAVSEVIAPSDGIPSGEELSKEQCTHHSQRCSRENSSWTAGLTEVQRSSDAALVLGKEKQRAVLDVKLSEVKQHQEHISLRESVECGDSTFNEISFSSVAVGKAGEKRRAKVEKTITLQVLRRYFAGSLKDAAKSIGVCPTTLKRICRQHGINRWPSRKIKKVGYSLQKLQHVIDSVPGASGAFNISTFHTNFSELVSPKLLGNSTLSTSRLNDQAKQTNIQPEGFNFLSQAATSNSPSSSCSQSSSSSHCCSGGTHLPSKFNISGNEDLIIGKSSGDGEMKRVRSEAELHVLSQEGSNLFPRYQSLRSLKEQLISDSLQPISKNTSQIAQDLDAQRVKVTYGDEKIRFRMQRKWRFKDLLHEITRRFNIEDISRFDLKYLDDDSEWVLLTCGADLEECIDVCRSSQGNTIKLSLQVSHHHLDRSS